MTINIYKDELGQLPTVTFIEELLRVENALSSIKIYKKDIVEVKEINDEISTTYGDEYLESEHIGYSTIQSIIKHSNGGMISIVLIIDSADISGDKAKQLEQENKSLNQQIIGLQSAMAELTMMLNAPQ